MQFTSILISSALLISQALAQTPDYCAPTLCQGQPHVACLNRNVFATTCPRDAKIITTGNYITTIVNELNSKRNDIALGNVGTLPSCMRMGILVWNTELATLAQISVKRCRNTVDTCRNTAKFTRVGQLVYCAVQNGPYNATQFYVDAIQSWFSQNTVVTAAIVTSYTPDPTYDNYAQIAYDKNTAVGCAIIESTVGTNKQLCIYCNFSSSPRAAAPLCVEGCPLAQCMGRNSQYPGLCATTEVIDPNS